MNGYGGGAPLRQCPGCGKAECHCAPAAIREALERDRAAMSDRLAAAEVRSQHEAATHARPLSSWNEEDGPVLWWRFPIDEPPYVGSPLDDDFPNYVTHWTPIAIPEEPTAETKRARHA